MKNVKLIISKNEYKELIVELWIDGELAHRFGSFDSKSEARAFCDGFYACQDRFCILDKAEATPAAS